MTTNRRKVPEHWLPVFAAAGIRGTFRGLADATDRDTSLVIRVIEGHNVEDDAIEDVAEALNVKPAKVRELRGEPVRKPFKLPSKADRLSVKQREAILAVIDGMLESSADDSEVSDPSLIAAQRAAARRQRVKDGDQSSQISQRG